jgi:hypothetical protein
VRGDDFSLIKSSLMKCDEQTEQNITGYYYHAKGNLQDIFQYKSPLLFIIDEKKELRVYLMIKE